MYSLIITARMNGVEVWLMDILARTAAQPAHRLKALLPWNWAPASAFSARAAVNNVHHVITITQIAKDLPEDEDWLRDTAFEMGSRTA